MPLQPEAAPRERSPRELTVRAVLTGMSLGGGLALCNIYSGLKIGWSNNMSITAALLAFAFWRAMQSTGRTAPFSMLENNVNQTGASSAAAISSAGLVAAVPALTMLTGQQLTWPMLALWTFSVCLVGITVAIGLRRQMIITDNLPFPSGIASAETLKEMYAAGREAAARVWVLVGAGAFAAAVKLAEGLAKLPKVPIPGSYTAGKGRVTFGNLTFALEPSVLMVGVGGLIGMRAGISLLLGGVLAWGAIAPIALERGWATGGKPDGIWFGELNKWLLWPGVAMMVTASLTSFAFSWRSIARAFRPRRAEGAEATGDTGELGRRGFVLALVAALSLSTICQIAMFGISWYAALLGVLVTFVLAIVAARVAGETNITPVGAMGKITQLLFGVIAPGQAAPNLMAANVTGGAASQCADLMHDLKCGHLIGATPRHQIVAQLFGALAGALAGSAAYLILIPDPQTQLMTPEWPAPAVAAWKAVAEIFVRGLDAMPAGTPAAIATAGAAGIGLAILEKTLPRRAAAWVPSPASIGLAFVVPAYNALYMFFGAALAAALGRWFPRWSTRFAIVMFAGLIAGESLAGVALAIRSVLAK